MTEEEYQILLDLELSVNDDHEEVQLEATKQISLGCISSTQNTPAEVVAYRYWVSLIHLHSIYDTCFYDFIFRIYSI